jgi:hypothetical protein
MFPQLLLLSDLNSPTGLVINGAAQTEQIGWSAKFVGGLNGDGVTDIAIGAPTANPGGLPKAGKVYVIFGQHGSGRETPINLANFSVGMGFVLSGLAAGDGLGWSVSGAGDLNGDRVDDLLVGAPFAGAGGKADAGQAYVIFGQRGRTRGPDSLNFSTLNGRTGFVIKGQHAGDRLGYSVSTAGDINADGVSDILVGAPMSRSSHGRKSGQSYLIFGQRGGFNAVFDWTRLNAATGVALIGGAAGDQSGFSVAQAGDLNGDGVSDVIIGAPSSSAKGMNSGRSYVVFGKRNGLGDRIDLSLLDGRNGFVINGVFAKGRSGYSVSGAGDVNGDRIADVIIGAPFANPNGLYSGQSYVVLGKRGGYSSTLDLGSLNGKNGWSINGVTGRSGFSVAGIGDVNGDRLGDVIVGAPFTANGGRNSPGQGYVVWGRTAKKTTSVVPMAQLDPQTGLKLNSSLPEESVGYSVAGMGDFNGDRLMDFLIAAPLANPNGLIHAGQVYVVFGQPSESILSPNTTAKRKPNKAQGGAELESPPIPLKPPVLPDSKAKPAQVPLSHLER